MFLENEEVQIHRHGNVCLGSYIVGSQPSNCPECILSVSCICYPLYPRWSSSGGLLSTLETQSSKIQTGSKPKQGRGGALWP